jgi:hypothetical protein
MSPCPAILDSKRTSFSLSKCRAENSIRLSFRTPRGGARSLRVTGMSAAVKRARRRQTPKHFPRASPDCRRPPQRLPHRVCARFWRSVSGCSSAADRFERFRKQAVDRHVRPHVPGRDRPVSPIRAAMERLNAACGCFTIAEVMLMIRPNLHSTMPSITARPKYRRGPVQFLIPPGSDYRLPNLPQMQMRDHA